MKKSFLALALLFAYPLLATTYTVKPSGGSFTTIQAASNVAVAGDTVTVFCAIAGGTCTYAGWTQSSSGNAITGPILFQVNPGDNISLTSGISLGTTNYVTIIGFTLQATTSWTRINNYVFKDLASSTSSGRCFNGPSGNGSGASSFNQWINVSATSCGGGNSQAIILEGHQNLFDNWTVSNVADGMALYGTQTIIRKSHYGPISVVSSNHPDGIESSCSGDFPLVQMFYEENANIDWGGTDSDPNAHGFLLRDPANCGMTGNVIRYSVQANTGSYWIANDSNSKNTHLYNDSNSFTKIAVTDRANITFTNNDTGSKMKNVIMANSNSVGGGTPWLVGVDASSLSGFEEGGNIAFVNSYSGSWCGPNYTACSGTLAASDQLNVDPKFIAPLTDLHIQSGSPAIGHGIPLTTTVGSGSGSTTLVVADAGYFQDTFGITSSYVTVQPDCLRIRPSTVVCIAVSGINYATNTITLSVPASWSSGASIDLYSDSSGTQLLSSASAAQYVGAYDFVGSPAGTPTFTPGAGVYASGQSVTIGSTTAGATLCYTIDSSTPTGDGAGNCVHGTTYTVPVNVSVSLTLKAIATKSGFSDSAVGSAAYTINALPPAPAVLFSGLLHATGTLKRAQ